MARQTGKTNLLGRVGNVVYYKMNGRYYARAVSSLSGRRVKRDPKFKRTMEFAKIFGVASKLASELHRSLPAEIQNYKLYRKITGQANQLLKAGMTQEEVVSRLRKMFKSEKRDVKILKKVEGLKKVETLKHVEGLKQVEILKQVEVLKKVEELKEAEALKNNPAISTQQIIYLRRPQLVRSFAAKFENKGKANAKTNLEAQDAIEQYPIIISSVDNKSINYDQVPPENNLAAGYSASGVNINGKTASQNLLSPETRRRLLPYHLWLSLLRNLRKQSLFGFKTFEKSVTFLKIGGTKDQDPFKSQ